MQAACGLAQLERLPAFVEARNQNFVYLREKLKNLGDFIDIGEATKNSKPSWFGFPITLRPNAPTQRLELIRFLDQSKIGTRLLFAGNLIRQPYFEGVDYRLGSELPNTEITMNNTFWLGIYPALSEPHFDYIADQLEMFFGVNF